MPARSADPPVAAIENAHADLGLSYDEIAAALGANASTLHRWRAGETAPSPVFRRRLAALAEVTAAVRGRLGRRGAPTPAAWLDTPAVGVPGLAGERPRALLAAGQLERLAAAVAAAPAAPAPAERAPAEGRAPTGPGLGSHGRPAGARA